MPVWTEPDPPGDVARWENAQKRSKQYLRRALTLRTLGGAFVVLVMVAFLAPEVLPILVVLTLAGLGLVVFLPTWRIKQSERRAHEDRDARFADFSRAQAAWEAEQAAHEHRERERQQAENRWFPLSLTSAPSRVDVFGGTPDGWASLITTLGGALLHNGHTTLIVDFTEGHIGDTLAGFAHAQGFAATRTTLPEDSPQVGLLAGMEAGEAAEMLAEAVHSMRKPGDTVDQRGLDAELLTTVLGNLDAPVSFARVVAGLGVLRRVYNPTTDGPLTTAEIRAINAHVDTVGQGERTTTELQFLASVLGLLATDTSGTAAPDQGDGSRVVWPGFGLAVVATETSHPRRKDILDRFVFHRLLHELRTHARDADRGVVIVAGADHLGLPALEQLARQARRVGVRLVLLLEHLRDDLQQLLGTSDSAAILMRLGNAKEATAAAEFIGRGHRFVMSGVTEQVGTTLTDGTAHSTGHQDGTSDTSGTTTGRSRTGFFGTNTRSSGRSDSITESRSRSWQNTVNYSTAQATSTSTTTSRVYEFTVEPTHIQGLPATAFILVEPGPTGRRAVLGDCNPGITLLPHVATRPRRN